MAQIIYLILSILTLGFLVFVHELGHYYTARKLGMRVEAFSIGFGKPIYRWMHDGVQWQICWMPFGGYVKIAGMEDAEDPAAPTEGSFFSKTPFQRIKVALSGPTTNILFAFVIFSVLWAMHGREKSFSEYTHYIGCVDPQSDLYAKGVRAGDAILEYNAHPFKSSLDHMEAAILNKKSIDVTVEKQNYMDFTKNRASVEHFNVQSIHHPAALNPDFMTTGVVSSAQYLIYDLLPGQKENSINAASPMKNCGLQYGDRIVWAGGDIIFSAEQLSYIVNEPKVLLTVQRGEKVHLFKIPRVQIGEYKLNVSQKAELVDWQYDAGIQGPVEKLFFIPYHLNEEGDVLDQYLFFDADVQKNVFLNAQQTLEKGDHILAIDGMPISSAKELLQIMQTKHTLIMVQRGQSVERSKIPSWTEADNNFVSSFPTTDIQSIASAIGTSNPLHQSGEVVLLPIVEPKAWRDLPLSTEEKQTREHDLTLQKQQISKMEDAFMRERAMQMLAKQEDRLVLFVVFQDQRVTYNPLPWVVMKESVMSTWRILSALVQGAMSPKWLAGPVGIVNLMQTRFQLGISEALFWMGSISMQLGLLNLLPIPVFDGGHVCFALWEMITGRRPRGKILEMVISACAIALILFAIYITYHDLTR